MSAAVPTLGLYFENQRVGRVYDTQPLSFAYDPAWLSAHTLCVGAIPLQPGPSDAACVTAFFENLLPEGELRAYLFAAKQTSTLFGLLQAVAGDTAGGFVLLAGEQPPQPPSYEATSWQALAAELQSKTAAAIHLKGDGVRISLAGAQDKLSIALFADGVPRLGLGTSPSTHIVKPDMRRFEGIWASAINESLIMRTAALCGLEAAPVFYEPTTRACVVERFDRAVLADGSVARRMQYDLCQLSALPSGKKYEAEGGPSLEDCAELVRRYSTVPALDLRRIVAWVFFNVFTGNNDSHAKNLSIYSPAPGVARLTPFYDLMCTRIYPGLAQNFAFQIGGISLPGGMERAHWVAMAEQLNVRPAFVLSTGTALAAQLPAALDKAVKAMAPLLAPNDAVMAERLLQFVGKVTRQTAKRMQ